MVFRVTSTLTAQPNSSDRGMSEVICSNRKGQAIAFVGGNFQLCVSRVLVVHSDFFLFEGQQHISLEFSQLPCGYDKSASTHYSSLYNA